MDLTGLSMKLLYKQEKIVELEDPTTERNIANGWIMDIAQCYLRYRKNRYLAIG
jgi:hypothetical protein